MNNSFFLYSLSQLREIVYSFQKTIPLSRLLYPIPCKLFQDDQSFQSMIAGGSVFEKAIIKQAGEQISILNLEKSHVPLFTDKEVFLRFIYSHINPSVKYIAINFTYPTQPVVKNNIIDGCLIKGTKGHTFTGLIGKNVGEELTHYIKKQSGKTIIVTLANDTICLLLAGMNNTNTVLAGGVIGTGMNFGIYDGKHLVNLESGNFNKLPQTETGKQIDAQSSNPKVQLFEKEVSGKYLFEHYNLIAAQHGLSTPPLFSSSQLHDLACSNTSRSAQIAQLLFRRSASLAACQIAGIYYHLKQKQLSFIMEGTVFWTAWNYKAMVEEYLALFGIPQGSVRFIKIEHSNILGAAKLVLGI